MDGQPVRLGVGKDRVGECPAYVNPNKSHASLPGLL